MRRGSGSLAGWTTGIAVLLASGAANLGWAQAPPLPSGVLPSQEPLPTPEFRKPPPETLQLPPVKPPEAERAPTILRVTVRKIRITGNTVIPAAELESIAAPFENRELTNTDLEELRQRLTQHYISRGYINSGAVIPDQKVEDGVVDMRIVEGRLTRTEIEGTVHFDKDYFSDRIAISAGPPLNLRELEQGLQVLLNNPMVKSMNAQLVPGERPGEAVLKAQVEEAPRYDISVVADNKLAPSLGEAKLTLLGAVNNLIGRGDQLGAEFGYAEGIPHDLRLRYRTPITARDTALGVHYEKTKAVVQEEPFDVLDITSTLETIGVELSHPVYRTQNRQLVLSSVLERRETETTLLDVPFSFSPGVEDGKATVSVLRLAADYLDRGRTQVIAARSTISIGLDAFDSTINADAPDSRFVTWLNQFQWVQAPKRATRRPDPFTRGSAAHERCFAPGRAVRRRRPRQRARLSQLSATARLRLHRVARIPDTGVRECDWMAQPAIRGVRRHRQREVQGEGEPFAVEPHRRRGRPDLEPGARIFRRALLRQGTGRRAGAAEQPPTGRKHLLSPRLPTVLVSVGEQPATA